MEFLAETAFLTRGLACLSNDELAQAWPYADEVFVWLDAGKITCGTMEKYLEFRTRAWDLPRLDCTALQDARHNKMTASLTASGTMAACQELGIDLAVTCGMGGVGNIKAEQICADLPALAGYPVALLASSPKDMLDIPATIKWLTDREIHVVGPDCTGWVFNGEPVAVPERLSAYKDTEAIRTAAREDGLLILNPIPPERRVADRSILDAAIAAGLRVEAEGGDYHPAANAEIHRLTKGYSAHLQLQAFIDNMKLARIL